ncbi:MAG: O-antigen ligase family protein [Elusimicrobia bacterium]|nr:O-antigen ligase family protein [Elusimicrobiota bacterium]
MMLVSFCLLFYIIISIYDGQFRKFLYAGLILVSSVISLIIILQYLIGRIPDATFPNPNLAAGYIACGATLVFSFMVLSKSYSFLKTPKIIGAQPRYIYFVLFLIFFTAILLTHSRGGLFSLICGIAVVSFLKSRKTGILIFVGSILVIFILLPEKTIAGITKTDGGDAYVHKRTEIWGSALNIIKEKPFLGTGPGNFNLLFHKYNFPVGDSIARYGKSTRFAHNEFLQIAAEGGIFVLAVFIWILIIILKNGFKTSPLPTAVLFTLIGHSFVDFNLHLPATMILMMFFISDILYQKLNANDRESNPPRRTNNFICDYSRSYSHSRLFAFATIIFFIFNSFNYFYKPFDAEKYKKNADRFIVNLPEKALEIYKKIIKYSPNNFEYRRTVGELYYMKNDRVSSIENLKESLKLNPKDPFTITTLANIYYNAEEYNKSKYYLLKAMDTEPHYLMAKYLLAKIDEKQKRYVPALTKYREIISTNELLKDTQFSSGYEKSLLRIDMSAVYNSMGIIYMNTGKLQNAVSSYNTAIQINPSNAEAHSNLASVYFIRKNYKTALKHAKLAVHYENREPLHLKNLILIYQKLGNEKEITKLKNKISALEKESNDKTR